MTDRIIFSLPEHKDSYGLLTYQTARTAVIFVHGFMGHPVRTWLNFQGMCDSEDAWWQHCDLFFYSYESVSCPTLANAQDLLAFVHALVPFPKPDRLGVAPVIHRPVHFSAGTFQLVPVRNPLFDLLTSRVYTSVTLVGHSEGGFVLRRMILREIDSLSDRGLSPSSSAFLARTECLKLFAPAIMGRQVSGWRGFLVKRLRVLEATLHGSVAFGDLDPTGRLIPNTQVRTERAMGAWPNVEALRAKILWGDGDRIVAQDCYEGDRQELVRQRDHVSICKPTASYSLPLSFVREP